MKTYKAIIVEDEQPAAELLEAYLKNFPEIELLCICNDGFSGLKSINEHNPDLIFLDIQMPKLSGFEMLEVIDKPPVVIFTTAFDEYAMKAFDVHAVDYLLKPFSRERFAEALSKALIRIQSNVRDAESTIQSFVNDFHSGGRKIERIIVKNNTRVHIIPIAKISHISSCDDYVIIHANGEEHIKQSTMQYYEDSLPDSGFVRIHRSYIVNVEYIEQIILWEKDTYKVRLKTGEELRASRAGYKRLKELL